MGFDGDFHPISKERPLVAWEYNPADEDQRSAHQYTPNRPVSMEHLKALGVLSWHLDASNWENNPDLEQIKRERGYSFSTIKTVSREALPDFDDQIKGYFEEHTHTQEEIRFILEGSGYWDIRDQDEKWIRFFVQKGDVLILPPGMFHRFTVDKSDYVKALLLFTEVPGRTQESRSEELAVRKQYIQEVLNKMPKSTYHQGQPLMVQ